VSDFVAVKVIEALVVLVRVAKSESFGFPAAKAASRQALAKELIPFSEMEDQYLVDF
jgi:hypothetical protein